MAEAADIEQKTDTDGSRWPTYRLLGLTLASDFSFTARLTQGGGAPDLTFTCVVEAPLPFDGLNTTPAYASPYHTADGSSTLYLYQLGTCNVLRFTHVADFYLWSDRILCHLLDSAQVHMVEIYLLGTVLSFWLESHGFPVLHASAVAMKGTAIAFLSNNRGGKSSLAAALMQAGYPLLTDDILPIERQGDIFAGRPSYPQMRLWPDEAQHLLGHSEDLERVHPELSKRRVLVGPGGFGTFCDTSQSLACLYLPERHDLIEQIEITPVPPQEAMIELVRHSFTPRIVEAMGMQPRRLGFFAQLIRQVPVRRLAYPSGFDFSPAVRNAILADIGV